MRTVTAILGAAALVTLSACGAERETEVTEGVGEEGVALGEGEGVGLEGEGVALGEGEGITVGEGEALAPGEREVGEGEGVLEGGVAEGE